MVASAHVDGGIPHPYAEAAILRQALLGDIEPRHELQPCDQRVRHAAAVDQLFLQHAVDPQADAQLLFARLDVDVRGARLHGVVEHGLQQLDDGGIGRAFLGGELLDVDIVLAQVVAHRLGERGDLVGLAVHRIEGLEQLALAHERQADRLLEPGLELVIGVQVRGIGHADQEAAGVLEQHDGAVAARQRLGQQAHRLLVDARLLQIDDGDLQVARQELEQRAFRHESEIRQHAAELAAGAPLLHECGLQLLLADGAVLDQRLAEPDPALAAAGCRRGAHGAMLPRILGSIAAAWSTSRLVRSAHCASSSTRIGRSRITSSVRVVVFC